MHHFCRFDIFVKCAVEMKKKKKKLLDNYLNAYESSLMEHALSIKIFRGALFARKMGTKVRGIEDNNLQGLWLA